MLAALSDVVTVAPSGAPRSPGAGGAADASSAAYAGATPMAPGAAPPAVPTKDSYDPLSGSGGAGPPRSMGARFAAAFRRQTSEEKETKRKEKERRMRGEMSRHESKSSRMDVIDKLDMSGIHGSSSESPARTSDSACLLTRCGAQCSTTTARTTPAARTRTATCGARPSAPLTRASIR